MLDRVALVRNDVSEELSASFFRVTRIGELGTMLAVTSNRRMLRRNTTQPRGVTSQKTPLFIVTTVKITNLTYVNFSFLWWIWSLHSNTYGEHDLSDYSKVYYCRHLMTFWKNISPLSSGPQSKPSKKLATSTWHAEWIMHRKPNLVCVTKEPQDTMALGVTKPLTDTSTKNFPAE
jgi:hypothetical protein